MSTDDDPTAHAHWVHGLRNAVSLVGMNMRVAARLMEKGRWEEAQATLKEGQQAWERCQLLLRDSPQPVAPPPPAAVHADDRIQPSR